jgi:hypothetical protein
MRGMVFLVLVLVCFSGVFADPIDIGSADLENVNVSKPDVNVWNETVMISESWEKLIGVFFGFNLKGVDTEISVRETLVLIGIFLMFFVLVFDILKLALFFKAGIGPFSGEGIAAFIVTMLVSLTGSFIGLKDLFIRCIAYTISSLNWGWLNYMVEHKVMGIIFTMFVIIPLGFILHEILSYLKPFMERYSKVSRAEATGRRFNEAMKKSGYSSL